VRVIPVVDLKDKKVVHGVGGRRDAYKPIESQLVDSPLPAPVADALVQKLGASEAYVADLDAIEGATPDWDAYGQLAGAGLRLWIDAGLTDVGRAAQIERLISAGAPFEAIIAGLETVGNVELLAQLLEAVGTERLVFSLDLRDGKPIVAESKSNWHASTAEIIAREVIELGICRLIVLDLAQVGVSEGVTTLELCRALRNMSDKIEIIAGGGVRGVDDLLQMHQAGCNGALVASALHDGRLTRHDLDEVAVW